MSIESLASWARENRIETVLPPEFPQHGRGDPRRDFGRVTSAAPLCLLRPTAVDGLARTLHALAEHQLPYRFRGGGWSSGGQVTADGAAVVDLTGLNRIVEDRPEAEEITVEGGATWLAVANQLRKTGRRPLVVPANLHLTVGGSLSVADVGDTSSLHGLTVAQVVRLTLVTPDGEIRRVAPADELFRHALGGVGLLGAIAEATLRTMRRPPTLIRRTLAWVKPDAFCSDAPLNADLRLYEIFEGAMTWLDGAPVIYMGAGNFADAPAPGEPGLWEMEPNAVTAAEKEDRLQQPEAAEWNLFRPGLQVAVPMAAGGDVLSKLSEIILGEPILRENLTRVGLVAFKTDDRFPLAPQPPGPLGLALMLRPQVGKRATIDKILPLLRGIGVRALDAGAKLGMASIQLGVPDLAEKQFGLALDRLRGLKREVDPSWLCNRGVVEGLSAGG